ncbi:MBL fold metallo-hydrolase [Wukongibacter baidiensis]|uniref:MBL fold metallo-hydrolase n=1 Tax=Wukongibacter baidiensis TaxID=1723361 RepID=UPI003D7FDB59
MKNVFEEVSLRDVDSLRVTSIVDNNADRSFAKEKKNSIARRYSFPKEAYDGVLPIAEHGFSMMIETKSGKDEACILIDAGVTLGGFVNNIKALKIDPNKIETVVITHGHADHFLGLPALSKKFNLKGIKVVAHPAAFYERKFSESQDGPFTMLKTLVKSDLEELGFKVESNENPIVLGNGMIIASGAVPRDPKYDNTLPFHYRKSLGGWQPDPDVIDDQFVVVNVRGAGLVIITGCGHSGIINIIRHAQKLTGEKRILAVIGGLHLYQNPDSSIIYKELENINPKYIVPTHCTGWRDIHSIARIFPEEFIQNSVGTVYSFSSL